MRRNRKTAAVLLLLCLLGVLPLNGCGSASNSDVETAEQTISVSLNREGLAYAVCYVDGLGPKRLDYAEHQEVLDALFDAIEGAYSYAETLRIDDTDGAVISVIELYDDSGGLLHTVSYRNSGELCLKTRTEEGGAYSTGKYTIYLYDLYENSAGKIDFSAFEACVNLYGELN